jgi:hypothetical protein
MLPDHAPVLFADIPRMGTPTVSAAALKPNGPTPEAAIVPRYGWRFESL